MTTTHERSAFNNNVSFIREASLITMPFFIPTPGTETNSHVYKYILLREALLYA